MLANYVTDGDRPTPRPSDGSRGVGRQARQGIAAVIERASEWYVRLHEARRPTKQLQ